MARSNCLKPGQDAFYPLLQRSVRSKAPLVGFVQLTSVYPGASVSRIGVLNVSLPSGPPQGSHRSV